MGEKMSNLELRKERNNLKYAQEVLGLSGHEFTEEELRSSEDDFKFMAILEWFYGGYDEDWRDLSVGDLELELDEALRQWDVHNNEL